MKKVLLSLASALFVFGAVSCQKENGNGDGDQVAQIAVFSPDDLEEFDLDYENQQKKLTFEWESDDASATYSIIFSLSEEMTETESVEVGTGFVKDLTHLDFDNILADLGVGEYKRGTLYWAIQGVSEAGTSMSEVRSMELFRFYKPFVDPRDNEEYRVCKVVDKLTGDYAVWLADNLRATKYSDGTEIGENGVKFYSPGEDGDPEMVDIYGGYYTWTAMMRGDKGAEEGEKIQGVAPQGWHIPTKAEWDFLINACTDSDNPAESLKNKDYWDPASLNVGKNTIGFNMAAAGYIWEIPVNDVIENGAKAYFWTATAPKEGDVYPWDPPVADFPNQGVTYGFDKDDFGAALYPYSRSRGYSVRCVLD